MPKGTPSSLYRPDELMTTAEYLRHTFGKNATPSAETETAWQMAEMRQFLRSHHYAVSNYFVTRDELTNEMLPMRPFTGQAILSVCFTAQLRAGYARNIIEYKPRQCGWTSWNLGYACHNALMPNRGSLVLVDDEDVANKIATKVATMFNGLPPWMQPMRRIQNLKQFHFENPNPKDRIYSPGLNSSLQIAVPTSFRGDTPAFVLISEFAFMNDERKALVTEGLIPAMHMTEHVSLIIDTTPNGFDDYYHPMITEAMEDNPRWTKRLMTAKHLTAEQVLGGILGVPDRLERPVPAISFWHHHEGYATKDDGPRAELRKMTREQKGELESTLGQVKRYGGEEEKHLKEYWDLTLGQLFWRRRKIDMYKMPTPESRLLTFRQEFPSDIASGFVNYEHSPFDIECLEAFNAAMRPPKAEGIMRRTDSGEIVVDQTFRSDWQSVRIYEPPRPGEQYSMGVDTGIAYESLTSDATVAQIVRKRDQKLVATYEARAPEYILREQLQLLYQWYNHAYYAVETKGIGYALVRSMIDMGMANVYYWRRLDREDQEPTKFPGWDTNERTRPLMDELLVRIICNRDRETNAPDPLAIVPDRKTLQEIASLTRTSTGALKASSGHDDHVDALAIAYLIQEDPWGGFIRNPNKPSPERKEDFERLFAETTATTFGPRAYSRSRNRPDLANI
jgi:hypothetical protein